MIPQFSDELKNFILSSYPYMKATDISSEIASRFGYVMSDQAIRCYASKHGVSKVIRFTCEEKEWIKQNWSRYKNSVELTSTFNQEFDTSRTFGSIKKLLKQLVPDSHYGHSGGRKVGEGSSVTAKAVGTETFKGGYWWVKINDVPLSKNYTSTEWYRNWKQKHVYVWEQHYHQTVPEGCKIVFLDGNRTNFNIDNLYCADTRSLIYLVSNNMWYQDGPLTLTAIKWAELKVVLSGKKLRNSIINV